MRQHAEAPKLALASWTSSPVLDIVVPFTTPPLTRAALAVAARLSAELHPLVRIVRTQAVPFPLDLDIAPVSSKILREQLSPLAAEFGAHLQICYARDPREALAHVLGKDSLVVMATRRRVWKTREERLAGWLLDRNYAVLLESVDKNNA